MSTLSLNLSKILITGGNGDIAKAIASELSGEFDVSMPNRYELDVSSPLSVDSYFENKEFDIVLNAAGTLYSAHIIDSEPDLWIKDIEVNLIGTYLITRAALKRNKKALIINVASTAAYASYADWTSYCASKAGVLKVSQGIFKDGFNVVTLCPGAIDTKIRNGLNIKNPNVMSLSEGIIPIIDTIYGKYKVGDIIQYRKNEIEIKSSR